MPSWASSRTWAMPTSGSTWCGPVRAPPANPASSCRTNRAWRPSTRSTRCACTAWARRAQPWTAWVAQVALCLRRRHWRALCRRGQHRAAAAHRRLGAALVGARGADLLGAGAAGQAGRAVAGLFADGADQLPQLCRRAGAIAGRRRHAPVAVAGVGRWRAVVGRAALAHPLRLRLCAAQQLRLVGVLRHGLGMRRKAACT